MFKEEKTIREELVKANRLKEVINEVSTIFLMDDSDYPVYPFQYDRKGKLVKRVPMKTVLNGILVYFSTIYVKENELELSEEELEALDALNMFFNSKLEMCMHNYANSCAHRKQPKEEELEHIRVLSILNNSIIYLTTESFKEEDCFWDIPEGWKKK